MLPESLPPDELYVFVRIVVSKALTLPKVLDGRGVLQVVGEINDGGVRYVGTTFLRDTRELGRAAARRHILSNLRGLVRWGVVWCTEIGEDGTPDLWIECGQGDDGSTWAFRAACRQSEQRSLGPQGEIRFAGTGDSLLAASKA